MQTDNTDVIDQRVLGAITDRRKLELLLEEAGQKVAPPEATRGFIKHWALSVRLDPTEVYHVIKGRRRGEAYNRHRDEMARATRLSREDVDRMLDGEPAALAATG